MSTEGIHTVIVLAFSVSAISMTVSKTGVSKPLRAWLRARNEWLGDLVDCPYCTSHWVALAAVVVYQPVLISSRLWLVDLVVSAFVVVAVAALISGLIYRAFAGMPKRRIHHNTHTLRPSLTKK